MSGYFADLTPKAPAWQREDVPTDLPRLVEPAPLPDPALAGRCGDPLCDCPFDCDHYAAERAALAAELNAAPTVHIRLGETPCITST